VSPPHTRTTAAATGGNGIPAPRRKGYTHLNVQFGRGAHAPTFAPHARHGLVCRSFRFTDAAGIAEEMAGAALIISHAGSGSIIESLSRQKPLLVVVNDALMDNHQAELAGQLDADGHLHCTGCQGLLAALQQRTPPFVLPSNTDRHGRLRAADAWAATRRLSGGGGSQERRPCVQAISVRCCPCRRPGPGSLRKRSTR